MGSRQRQRDPHQKQYVPLRFGGGHNDCKILFKNITWLF